MNISKFHAHIKRLEDNQSQWPPHQTSDDFDF